MEHILQIIKRIAGMPDYERYTRHLRECHPGEVPLSERQFYARYLETRYSGAGSRCC